MSQLSSQGPLTAEMQSNRGQVGGEGGGGGGGEGGGEEEEEEE